jgi:hypothetical protein
MRTHLSIAVAAAGVAVATLGGCPGPDDHTTLWLAPITEVVVKLSQAQPAPW